MARGLPRIHVTIPEPLLAKYQSGLIHSAEVGRILGVSPPMVLRELHRLGINTSKSSRKLLHSALRKHMTLPVDPDKVPAQVAKLYGQGQTLQQIATTYGLTREGVRQILLRQGVLMRSRRTSAPLPPGTANEFDGPRFAACLRSLRTAARMSMNRLAAESGVVVSTVWALERGWRRNQPSATVLQKLARALGVRLEALGIRNGYRQARRA